VLQTVLDAIRSMPPAGAYSVIFALVFGEAAVFIGFVLPGETAVLIGGVLAAGGRLSLTTLCVLVFVAAVVGDTVGYEVGRLLGPRVIGWRRLDRFRARLDAAQLMLRERGGPAVFLARFTAFLRAAMPGLAGLSRMPYRRFLAFNAAGGLIWGVGFCLIGYLAGASYERVASLVGRGAAVTIAVLILLGLGVWLLRRRRASAELAASAKTSRKQTE
jgi:membrane protein DedA with SNARE-associated domain